MSEENKNEKPFNFWLFMAGIFIALIILTTIIVGVPYLLMK